MSVDTGAGEAANVETIFAEQPEPLSEELHKLRDVLIERLPREAAIKFEFDGKLRLHVDVRQFEDVAVVEALLPTLGGGIYRDLQRTMSRHNSFLHRVTAAVKR